MKLTIDRLGRSGDGVATTEEGVRISVPQTLPGEIVEGKIIDRKMPEARVLTPAPERVRAPCSHFKSCGGCTVMHVRDDTVAAWKRQIVQTALSAQGISAPFKGMHVSPPRSRRRVVFSGRRTKKNALVGFHARASDVIVDVVDCHVIRPEIQAALPLLREIVQAGGSRNAEVSLAVIHGPAGLDVTVTGGKMMDQTLFGTLAGLAEEGDLARLTWEEETILRRPPALRMGAARVVPPPGAFLQATAEGEAALLACVQSFTQGQARIVDLFAGIGTFTLPLAARAEMHAVEGLAAPLAALDAGWRNASGLHRVTHATRDLANNPLQADELDRFDAVVIDPPRVGAASQVKNISNSAVKTVAYVSCDPSSFARDSRILLDGGFVLEQLFVIDQFRWASHVEIAAQFKRR